MESIGKDIFSADPDGRDVHCEGPFRRIDRNGRAGVNALSAHSRIGFDLPEINAERGTLSLWMLALEELSTQSYVAYIRNHQPDYQAVPVLTDHAEPRDLREATFAMAVETLWYPHFFVKRTKGAIYPEAYEPSTSCIVGLGHWPVQRETWYHLAYTWDRSANDFRVYLNGVLAGTASTYPGDHPLRWEDSPGRLYAGHPKLALGGLRIEDEPLSPTALQARLAAEPAGLEPEVTRELERIYAGRDLRPLDWKTPADWQTLFEDDLSGPEALKHFYVQSHDPGLVEPTEEGLRVRTPFERTPKPADWDEKESEPFDADQIYLWLERFFEGDIHFSFEFKSRAAGGLGLLAAQASGMHGEDFMADYPRRKTGSMRMVFGENVRNYHWEYYRGMNDTRNDVASSGLIKEPWQWPLAYQCLEDRLALDVWHRLDFVHVGDRLLGALDGRQVFDVTDNPHANCGPVYRRGRFALRAMWRSDLTYRNLRVSGPPDAVCRQG